MSNQLMFNDSPVQLVNHNNQIWITSAELAKALQYSNSKAVTMIYNKYSDEFTSCMSQVLEISTSGNYIKKVRIFSLRGCHLVAMFSRTPIAKEFRKWVLDILDKETHQQTFSPTIAHIPYQGRWVVRYIEDKVEVKNIDGKVCIDNTLFLQLQKDSVYYRNKLIELNDKLKQFTTLTNNFMERTKITSGECSASLFSVPLKLII
ncbi:hypothetical protein A9G39_03480 [Gilliamella sp. Imp1-6]|nr:hypothetical protein A9G39_03480 [Gilliamella apicola]